MPYHWHYVSRATLLTQAAQYEAAYEALVSGGQGPLEAGWNSGGRMGAGGCCIVAPQKWHRVATTSPGECHA